MYTIIYAKGSFDLQYSLKDWNVKLWLQKNCKNGYGIGTDMNGNKIVNFSDEAEALEFALHWS